MCVNTDIHPDIHPYEWVCESGLGESWGDMIKWEVCAECWVIRLDLQYCYFLNLRCFVGGANSSCLGCCIMECFIHLSNKSRSHVDNESEQRGASACCGDPHGELPGAEQLRPRRTGQLKAVTMVN